MSFIDNYDSGKWRIESLISESYFGKVYKICKEENGVKSYAALDVIPVPSSSEINALRSEGLGNSEIRDYINSMVEKITKPLKLAMTLKGLPNIAAYDDFQVIQNPGKLGATILIRIELLEKPLSSTELKLPESEIIKIGIDISRALESMAAYNIIHGDIRPSNILYSKSGEYKLIDFDIAGIIDRTLTCLSKKGTYSFMAPELYQARSYGASVDIYSLGITLYWLANNGRAPFLPDMPTASDRENAIYKRTNGDPLPPPAEASPELSKIILKACAYYPKDRFSSPTEMRNALERLSSLNLLSFIDEYDSGKWRIESLISESNFGKVYKIYKEENGFKTYAALNVIPVPSSSEIDALRSEGLGDSDLRSYINSMVEDITKPLKLAMTLKGLPNIAAYDDCQVIQNPDELGATILIRMELLEKPLSSTELKLPESEIIKIGIDISRALESMATHNIVHRDVKPSNIIYSKSGEYKLADFDIARIIDSPSTGLSIKGTYSFMAPEVYQARSYGASVDIYSLGISLYRLANNGRTPFLPDRPTVSDRENALYKRMKGDPLPPPAEASPKLSKIILKACAYNPKDRFSSPTEMRNTLEMLGSLPEMRNALEMLIAPPETKKEPEEPEKKQRGLSNWFSAIFKRKSN
ncbi:MAG: serine/threonine protein kinase [Clostridiales bacterium]|nr:serine/threonine protein kinase [Clostridiales bacterium]